MQTHFLNETTVRTSVNYGINNIKIEFDLPDENKQKTFENFSISTDEIDKMNIKISDEGNEKEFSSKIGKISGQAIFYLMSRGISEEEARAMIVRGFADPISKALPLEYAVEMNNLINLELKNG